MFSEDGIMSSEGGLTFFDGCITVLNSEGDIVPSVSVYCALGSAFRALGAAYCVLKFP